MADQPSLHIDNDWKKQAQEEKRRLAEEEQKKKAAGATTAPPAPATGASSAAAASSTARGQKRELPPPSFATLVQSMVTQALYYLGELATRGGEPVLNLDMAKHQIDMLGIIEQKTANNLTDDEKKLLDAALYETRMRYISVASQFLGP